MSRNRYSGFDFVRAESSHTYTQALRLDTGRVEMFESLLYYLDAK